MPCYRDCALLPGVVAVLGGCLRFLKGLVGDGVRFCYAAQLDEFVLHHSGFFHGCQHADRGFAALQLSAYALAVDLAESEVLVVQGACQAAAEQARLARPG